MHATSRNLPSLRIVWLHGADSRSTAISFRSVLKEIQTMDTSSDIRQRWLDEERSVRRRMADVGVISPDQLKSFGGLEFWGQALQGTVPAPPITRTLDGRLHALCTTTCLLFPMA